MIVELGIWWQHESGEKREQRERGPAATSHILRTGGEAAKFFKGQGEDDTPEGWTFFNLYSFARTELPPLLAESESDVLANVNF